MTTCSSSGGARRVFRRRFAVCSLRSRISRQNSHINLPLCNPLSLRPKIVSPALSQHHEGRQFKSAPATISKFPPNKINNGERQQSLPPRPMSRVIHNAPAHNNYHATPCAASRRFSSIGIANHRSHCNSLRQITCTFTAYPCPSVQLILANFENSPPLSLGL